MKFLQKLYTEMTARVNNYCKYRLFIKYSLRNHKYEVYIFYDYKECRYLSMKKKALFSFLGRNSVINF